ncbi:MAG: DUF4387 family protein [Chloroflexi bacterium]|nr:DUF4387 family protein [Chloroflexota bacterium]
MTALNKLVKVIRSKNAGPFYLTFDLSFDNLDNFRRVRDSEVLTRPLIAKLYNVPESFIHGIYSSEAAQAIKVSMIKPVPASEPECSSIFGSSYHVPLLTVDIP